MQRRVIEGENVNWLRLYHSIHDCPKVQNLPPREFKFWINCLVAASKNDPRGTLPPIEKLAFTLRLRAPFVLRSLTRLERSGLVARTGDVWKMHDWDTHQFSSDDVNQRVTKHRNAKRNVTGNADCNADATPSEYRVQIQIQNTDAVVEESTGTERPPDSSSSPESVEDDWGEPDASEIATGLVDELMPAHPKPCSKPYAVAAMSRVMADAVNPQAICRRIREAHPLSVAYWESERQRNPRVFIPGLDRWISDGDWQHPPRASPAGQNGIMDTVARARVLAAKRKEGTNGGN